MELSSFELPVVLETALYHVTPCIDCDIPGYLVLQPNEHRAAFSDLSGEALAGLGVILSRLEQAIRTVTGAEHVYVLRFSEGLPSVHLHLFARTHELAENWKAAAQPADGHINGPLLFAWARIRFHVNQPELLSADTLDTALRIRGVLRP